MSISLGRARDWNLGLSISLGRVSESRPWSLLSKGLESWLVKGLVLVCRPWSWSSNGIQTGERFIDRPWSDKESWSDKGLESWSDKGILFGFVDRSWSRNGFESRSRNGFNMDRAMVLNRARNLGRANGFESRSRQWF